MMQKLSAEYGTNKPFDDEELFGKIVSITYPEVGAFLKTYVEGTTPINYDEFLAKVGVGKVKIQVPSNPFLNGQTPYVSVNQSKEIYVLPNTDLNDFFKSLNIKGGDVLLAFNEKAYNVENIYDMVMESQNWKVDDAISVKIKRDGAEQTITGKVKLSTEEAESYQTSDASKSKLKESWLKG